MKTCFWIVVGLILWHYVGYPLVLGVLARLKRAKASPLPDELPQVSIIIAAHNEERIIARRIENCLGLDYPKDRLEIIVGSDGSTDRTAEIAKKYEPQGVRVLAFPNNRGRSQVHNDCVREATGEIVCFTDADTLYAPDCIRKLVRHYADPKVGCVGGELRSRSFQQGAIGGGQGLYWRWEYALRRWQSKLGVLTKASGANMSMRKELYRPVPDDVDIDQAAGPMVVLQGYRVVHEPEAIAYEEFPTSLARELATRRRLTIRALTALWRYRELLNPFKHPWLAFHTCSYRLLRYLMPFLLLGALTINGLLLREGWLYDVAFALQGVFYLLGFIGFFLEKRGKRFWIFSWPFAFLWFQVGILTGTLEFLLGKRIKAYTPN
jgi:cellulose synthase/poly-beta-1,6-N-acetylglucosamine synthase-like glycosyltransferase